MEEQWIEVFKTGRHTDSAGNERDWTEDDLDNIVSKYNPSEHEAPVVIGHPKKNAPAYGWVDALKREGQILYAKFKQLVPEFVDMVKRGLFKKRSIAFYPDLTLRHIGFLGAMPPSIKGLRDINFIEQGGYTMTIEFKENMSAGERLHRKVLEYLGSPRAVSKKMSYSDAFLEVCRIERDLAEEYAEELMGSTPKRKKDTFPDRYVEVSEKLSELVQEKIRENPKISFREAFDAVQLENPELTREYIEFLTGETIF